MNMLHLNLLNIDFFDTVITRYMILMSFNENLNRMIQLASLQKYFSNEKKSKVNYIKLSPEIKSNKSQQSSADKETGQNLPQKS